MIKTFLSVDIAMMKIAKPPDQLCSLGLGSCVGVAVYDPVAKIGGLIHILLPSIKELGPGHSRTKFADSGISDLVDAIIKAGASKPRLKAKMAGGATMFSVSSNSPIATIGKRNVESCRETLACLGIELVAEDTGGNSGRTIHFDIETGSLRIKAVDKPEKII